MERRSRRDAHFVEYVRARRERLFRTALLLCGDRGRAEDIVQTVLTRAYPRWEKVERSDSMDAYLRRAIVNAHLDEARRPWRRERPLPEHVDVPAAETPVSVEEADQLWTALRSLAVGQRRVVVLRHYWGLSVAETAADLGVSVGTVKSQTSAALARLRLLLEIGTTQGGPGGHRDR